DGWWRAQDRGGRWRSGGRRNRWPWTRTTWSLREGCRSAPLASWPLEPGGSRRSMTEATPSPYLGVQKLNEKKLFFFPSPERTHGVGGRSRCANRHPQKEQG